MKNISLLGASGSIGQQTIDVLTQHKDQFNLIAFSVGNNIDYAEHLIQQFQPQLVAVKESTDAEALQKKYPQTVVLSGLEGLVHVATYQNVDLMVNAVVGSLGLLPTIRAIEKGIDIALANKETLVTAGHIVMAKAKAHNVKILPVDSEHCAIFQCLNGENTATVNKIILTASGGSFRDLSREQLKNVTVEQALNHPNWSMGSKITIDSATMMNKGLEIIEAHWLFNMSYQDIDVVIHRQSVVHSMVEFDDTSVIAQLGTPDMRMPIQYALSYPQRLSLNGEKLDLTKWQNLTFETLDMERFPCVKMAYEAGKKGGSMPTVLNAANEQAVAAFLQEKIKFIEIEHYIEWAMTTHQWIAEPTLEQIIEIDAITRQSVAEKIKKDRKED